MGDHTQVGTSSTQNFIVDVLAIVISQQNALAKTNTFGFLKKLRMIYSIPRTLCGLGLSLVIPHYGRHVLARPLSPGAAAWRLHSIETNISRKEDKQ